jgi:hypothetical protein
MWSGCLKHSSVVSSFGRKWQESVLQLLLQPHIDRGIVVGARK